MLPSDVIRADPVQHRACYCLVSSINVTINIYKHLIFCLCTIFTPPKNKQKTKQKHTHLKIAAQQVIKNVEVIMHQTPEVVLVAKFMQIRKLVLICHHNYLILNSNNTTTVQTVQLLLSYCKLMQVDLTRCCHLLADLH